MYESNLACMVCSRKIKSDEDFHFVWGARSYVHSCCAHRLVNPVLGGTQNMERDADKLFHAFIGIVEKAEAQQDTD